MKTQLLKYILSVSLIGASAGALVIDREQQIKKNPISSDDLGVALFYISKN